MRGGAEGWSEALAIEQANAAKLRQTDSQIEAVARQARRVEAAAQVRAGAEPSSLAVEVAGTLKGLWTDETRQAFWVDNVPSAFRITDLVDGRQVIVHVMEVGR